MSGRSFLCDLWFSQTLRHKNYIYIYNRALHILDRSSTKAYTDCLKHQIEIIIIEQVDVSKVSDDPKSRLDECKKREWYWQNQLKTLKQYGGLNVREERS